MTPAERRHRDGLVRQATVQMVEAAGNTPEVRHQAARARGVTERTIRRWVERARAGASLAMRRGRPPDPVRRERRQGLIRAMLRLGPCAGVPTLRALFRDIPYRTIAALKRRFVRAIRRRRGWYRKRLRWLRSGATWAMDFTKPKARLPAGCRRLFLVRDLASGAQLAAVPCPSEKGWVARTTLAVLFLILGAPLLLKHDGGSGFIAHETQALLEEHGVVGLRSPPRTPQYNGSCERAGGTLKQRIEHEALIAGHAGRWTQANIGAALRVANATARPRGPNGPSPAAAFATRRPIDLEERKAFKRTRADSMGQRLETHQENHGRMPTCSRLAAIGRQATQHALCEYGYLEIRRGRISTPVMAWRADTNT